MGTISNTLQWQSVRGLLTYRIHFEIRMRTHSTTVPDRCVDGSEKWLWDLIARTLWDLRSSFCPFSRYIHWDNKSEPYDCREIQWNNRFLLNYRRFSSSFKNYVLISSLKRCNSQSLYNGLLCDHTSKCTFCHWMTWQCCLYTWFHGFRVAGSIRIINPCSWFIVRSYESIALGHTFDVGSHEILEWF